MSLEVHGTFLRQVWYSLCREGQVTEARIGSVPWFAGVFWFVLAWPPDALARGLFKVDARMPWWINIRPGIRWLIRVEQWMLNQATQCAIEAGASVEE